MSAERKKRRAWRNTGTGELEERAQRRAATPLTNLLPGVAKHVKCLLLLNQRSCCKQNNRKSRRYSVGTPPGPACGTRDGRNQQASHAKLTRDAWFEDSRARIRPQNKRPNRPNKCETMSGKAAWWPWLSLLLRTETAQFVSLFIETDTTPLSLLKCAAIYQFLHLQAEDVWRAVRPLIISCSSTLVPSGAIPPSLPAMQRA